MLDLVNQDRQAKGVAPLPLNEKLSNLARAHALDMQKNKFFSHINKQGLNPQARAHLAGIDCGVYENIAWRSSSSMTLEQMLSLIEQSFMAEPEGQLNHRYNILKPDHACVGIGVVVNNNKIFAVQEYADSEP